MEEELHILDKYMAMMKVRFADKVSYSKNIDTNCLNYKAPSLLLQPIVENALKYGYSKDHKTLKILISVQTTNDFLKIVIQNNGKPIEHLDTIFKRGTGLSNSRNRLDHLYGTNYRLHVENIEGSEGVKFNFKLPLEHQLKLNLQS
ncbi:sensor histidine kinase [Gramella sp. KN1008]|uniref:sensor histidine kinase n=1 Tax=Gramella sp. KN1008 TaxID=2529298 RepID=UPI0037431C06